MPWQKRLAKEWLWLLCTILAGYLFVAIISLTYSLITDPLTDSQSIQAKIQALEKEENKEISKHPEDGKASSSGFRSEPRDIFDKVAIEVQLKNNRERQRRNTLFIRFQESAEIGFVGPLVFLPAMYFVRFTMWSIKQVKK
ncbi:MAG: hypothetical protein JRF41_12690 [Deltaproteobacteria bacterium]|nr:hypothetical protein [Deltaproteobacteria bacterium]